MHQITYIPPVKMLTRNKVSTGGKSYEVGIGII